MYMRVYKQIHVDLIHVFRTPRLNVYLRVYAVLLSLLTIIYTKTLVLSSLAHNYSILIINLYVRAFYP